MEQSEDLTRIRELAQRARRNTVAKPCVLCGLVTRRRMLAVAEESGGLGAAANKRRVASFPLCHRHTLDQATEQTALQRVEIALGWIGAIADSIDRTRD